MQADGFEIHDIIMAYVQVISFSLGSVFTERKFLGGEDAVDTRIAMLKRLMSTSGAKYQSLSSAAEAIERWDFDEMLTEGVDALVRADTAEEGPVRPCPSSTRRHLGAQSDHAIAALKHERKPSHDFALWFM